MKWKLPAAFLAAVGFMLAFAGLANAQTPPTSSVTATSTFEITDKSVSVSEGESSGALELRPVAPHGSPKPKINCTWVEGGTNAFYDKKGRLVKVPWPKRTFVCKDKNSPSGWVKRGPKDCDNPFWPDFVPQPKNVFHGRYKIVAFLSFTATATVNAVARATASATARCELHGAVAEASASGSGFARARGTARATAKSRYKAIALATGKAKKRVKSKQERAEADAEADAKSDAWASASAKVECKATPPPGVPTPQPTPPGPTPTPPPTCPPGQVGTPPNCQTPPPSNVTVTGSTFVQSQKNLNQPCPPPNSSIVKVGASDLKRLDSPVFTGTGATQAAAQADLDAKLLKWRNDNQGTVDAQAQAQAQERLNAALLTCPAPPPANRPPQVEIVNPPAHVFENGQVQICANFSDPDGDNLQVSWSSSGGTHSNGRECITFTAGSPGEGSVTVTVSDGKESRSATVTFPIVKDDVSQRRPDDESNLDL